MTMPAPITAPWRSDIEAALQVVGAEDVNKPATVKAAKAALVLLKTVPVAALIEALPPLWARERARQQQQIRKQLYIVVPVGISLAVAFLILQRSSPGSHWLQPLISLFTCFNAACQFVRRPQLQGALTPLQKGILRTLHLRPHCLLVPLFIETLETTTICSSLVSAEAHRRHLTRLMPMWCDGDNPDLTPTQRRTLISAVGKITGRGGLMTRPLAKPLKPMDIIDADFATSALATLRHNRIPSDDKRARARTRTMLKRIPAPHAQDDPRRDVLIAAEEYVSLLRH